MKSGVFSSDQVGDLVPAENLRTGINSLSRQSTLAPSKHHNQLKKIITKHKVNSCFHSSIEWPYYRFTDSNMRPSIGWQLTKYHIDAEVNLFWKIIFAFTIRQLDVHIWERVNQHNLFDYRFRVMEPLLALPLNVNLHASDLSIWWPNDPSLLTNILGEMMANGLMNFHSTTLLSPSVVLLLVVWAQGWSWKWNGDKVRLLVRVLPILGADSQEFKSQLQF